MLAYSPSQDPSLGTRCVQAQPHVASKSDYERVANNPTPVAVVVHRVKDVVVPPSTMKFPARAPRHRNARESSCPIGPRPSYPLVDGEIGEARGFWYFPVTSPLGLSAEELSGEFVIFHTEDLPPARTDPYGA